MSKNQNAFIKKQKAELKKRKQKEKLEKKLARKEQPKSGDLEDMMAYVDRFGNITETPPEEEIPSTNKSKNQKFNNKQHSNKE
jgi:S-adenosylmethionine hydrolase